MEPHLGFGITAQRDPLAVGLPVLGEQLERLGYRELWANDGRLGSGLATLAAAVASTTTIDLCLGVAPLSARTPAAIAAEAEPLAIPPDRLVLGVGTGAGSTLAMVRDAVAELRLLLPGVRLAIAALGPRMCGLGGEVADVVLLNWASPERIAWSRQRIAAGAAAVGRPVPRVAAYVRVAIGPDAQVRLEAEAERYRARPRPYTHLFEAQQVDRIGIPGVAAEDGPGVAAQLRPYREALDSCVVRALPVEASAAGWFAVAEAATLRA